MKLLEKHYIEMEVVTEANTHEHWALAHKRHKRQKQLLRYKLSHFFIYKNKPLLIKFTRLYPGKLDKHDNLPMAFKYIVDAVSELIYSSVKAGRADDNKNLEWQYDQEKNVPGFRGFKIEVFEKTDADRTPAPAHSTN